MSSSAPPPNSSTATDHPGVIAHPPYLFLGTLLGGALIDRLFHLPRLVPTAGRVAGAVLFAAALALVIWGRLTMTRAGTNVRPTLPATRLVVTGPFRWSRNPLYLAMTLAYLGLALAFDLAGAFLLLVPLLALVHWGVIRREERYLTAKFGDTYLRYKAVTRRWI